MEFRKVSFTNPMTGQMRRAPIGFSFTVLFFGCFPPLFRGDFKWAFIMAALFFLTFGISHFIFMFIYNKLYITDLVNQGFKVTQGEANINYLSKRVGFNLPVMRSNRSSVQTISKEQSAQISSLLYSDESDSCGE